MTLVGLSVATGDGDDDRDDDRDTDTSALGVAGVRLQRAGDLDAGLLVDREGPLDVATPVSEPAPAVAPQPAADPPPEPVLTGPEAIICAYAWDCGTALRIARCESGPDYYAAPAENPRHRGAYQLSYVHAPRFARRGWDWNTDGLILERNVAIAFELWLEQGWRPWSCA